MDRDDRRRYFVVGSVIYEIVTPLFRQRLENDYKQRGFASFQAFADSQPIIHILFHLRHTNVWCCQDKNNCRSRASLPLNYNQWDLLFKQINPAIRNHLCHCQYTANPVQLDDLDLTLAGLILQNCCKLGPAEEIAIKGLRKFKNNYLSHNTKGCITQSEYNIVWAELTRLVLQLDNTKQDDLIRIENRPLDEPLCMKYCIEMLDVHKKLEEMNDCIQQMDTSIQGNNVLLQGMNTSVPNMDTSYHGNSILPQGMNTSVQNMDTSVHGISTSVQNMGTSVQGNSVLLQGINTAVLRMDTTLQELLQRGALCQCYNRPVVQHKPYKLGQSIFHLHHQFDLRSVLSGEWRGIVTGGVMMDDGRLVFCLLFMYRLLICNTDGSQTDSIPLQYQPYNVTAVNNSTVAVTSLGTHYIVMYDINNKHKLKSIQLPEVWCSSGMTTIDNKLVVGGGGKLYIIDHQTGEVVQTIIKEEKWSLSSCLPFVHVTGDKIFYNDGGTNKLYCYSYTDDKHSTTTLPSRPRRITSLQDGSLYVLCRDRSVQHVSSDGKHYKPVTTEGLKSVKDCMVISYIQKQRKLVTCTLCGTVKVFNDT